MLNPPFKPIPSPASALVVPQPTLVVPWPEHRGGPKADSRMPKGRLLGNPKRDKPKKPENPGFNNYCIFGAFYGDFRFK